MSVGYDPDKKAPLTKRKVLERVDGLRTVLRLVHYELEKVEPATRELTREEIKRVQTRLHQAHLALATDLSWVSERS